MALTHNNDHLPVRRKVAAVALCIAIAVAGCSSFRMPGNTGKAAAPASGHPVKEIDEVTAVWMMGPYPRGDIDDVRHILVLCDEYLAATGKGVLRYRCDDFALLATYGESSGLPSDNVLSLYADKDAGVWALCEGGVGYLPKGAARWTSFAERSGPQVGRMTSLALSADGRRVWLAGTYGLASADVADRRWRTYPRKNLVDILVSPDDSRVWCRRIVPSECSCGWNLVTCQLNPATGRWIDIPESQGCPHVAAKPVLFCTGTNQLWLTARPNPPLLYDPSMNSTKTWPRELNWERSKGGFVQYWDWFSDMAPVVDSSGHAWFATDAGLWEYMPERDRWTGHKLQDETFAGEPLLAMTRDGAIIYWKSDVSATESIIAAYDMVKAKWITLWKPSRPQYDIGRQQLALSPDEKYLWWISPCGAFVGQPVTGQNTAIGCEGQTESGRYRKVYFDEHSTRALIATTRGIVCTDYAGTALRRLTLWHCDKRAGSIY